MVQYATDVELGIAMGQTVDTARADLLLQIVSSLFSRRAATWWESTTSTYQVEGYGQPQLFLPFYPVSAVSAVRFVPMFGATQTITDYRRIGSKMYRAAGFGHAGAFPPDIVEVDLTYGYAAPTDDVKGVVLETAASAYTTFVTNIAAESVDDYSVKYASGGGVALSDDAEELADFYRGTFAR